MPAALPFVFFLTALLYATVGFGGGSTYNALLVLVGTDYRLTPTIALICNLIVVTGNLWAFRRTLSAVAKRLTPFLILSAPAAWLGGRIPISELVFVSLLGVTLFLAGARLAVQNDQYLEAVETKSLPAIAGVVAGAFIGLLAGLVGIGGGIFLAPVLYYARWGTPREIASACSLFIFVNSAAGLAGQASKLQLESIVELSLVYWPLFVAVIIGGLSGAMIGKNFIQPVWIKRLTAILILYVSVRLLIRAVSLA